MMPITHESLHNTRDEVDFDLNFSLLGGINQKVLGFKKGIEIL
jgi:hypothetical protein